MEGWIKFPRAIVKSDMYTELTSKQRDVLITCLLLAGYKEKKWMWQGKIFQCLPGQFITSLDNLKKKCAPDLTIRSLRTALLKLEMWGFLTNKATSTGRLITICNWAEYQLEKDVNDKCSDKRMTNGRQTNDKRMTTTKNVKNSKECKEPDIEIHAREKNFEEKNSFDEEEVILPKNGWTPEKLKAYNDWHKRPGEK